MKQVNNPPVKYKTAVLAKKAGFTQSTHGRYSMKGACFTSSTSEDWNSEENQGSSGETVSAPRQLYLLFWINKLSDFELSIEHKEIGDKKLYYYKITLLGVIVGVSESAWTSSKKAMEKGLRKAMELIIDRHNRTIEG